MIALVMAGGKGTRMKTREEKLLLKYVHPVILHVVFALQNSGCFSKIFALTSPNSPKTRNFLQKEGIEIFDTPGNGYVEDLNFALKSFDEDVLVASGDLPLLDEEIILKVVKLRNPDSLWTSYLVTEDFMKSLGFRSEFSVIYQNKKCHFTGVSIIKAEKIGNLDTVKETHCILNDKRIAFNLNTKNDYELLEISRNLSIK